MVITKKSPLSILNHLRVINLTCLKQRFDDCLFQVSFYLTFQLTNLLETKEKQSLNITEYTKIPP